MEQTTNEAMMQLKKENQQLKDALEAMFEAYAREYWHRKVDGLGDIEIEKMQADAELQSVQAYRNLNKCSDCGKTMWVAKDNICDDCYRKMMEDQNHNEVSTPKYTIESDEVIGFADTAREIVEMIEELSESDDIPSITLVLEWSYQGNMPIEIHRWGAKKFVEMMNPNNENEYQIEDLPGDVIGSYFNMLLDQYEDEDS